MKRTALGVLTVCLLTARLAATQAPALPVWMVGCWAGDARGARVEERWSQAGSGALVGVGTTLAKGTLREFEFLRVVADSTTLSYIAQPGGRPPTTFLAASASASEVVFQNAQNDFPKRISYERAGDTLVATIDNDASDASRRQQFKMNRISCEP